MWGYSCGISGSRRTCEDAELDLQAWRIGSQCGRRQSVGKDMGVDAAAKWPRTVQLVLVVVVSVVSSVCGQQTDQLDSKLSTPNFSLFNR